MLFMDIIRLECSMHKTTVIKDPKLREIYIHERYTWNERIDQSSPIESRNQVLHSNVFLELPSWEIGDQHSSSSCSNLKNKKIFFYFLAAIEGDRKVCISCCTVHSLCLCMCTNVWGIEIFDVGIYIHTCTISTGLRRREVFNRGVEGTCTHACTYVQTQYTWMYICTNRVLYLCTCTRNIHVVHIHTYIHEASHTYIQLFK
jgi:hypothetical protein